jgi:hypothetical protein
MSDDFQHDVFLSHSSRDKAGVRDVAERLRRDGVKVWFDEWVLTPGDSIPAKIEKGLERSRELLCMLAHAFGSDWALLESGTFGFRDPLNKVRRFLPLRLVTSPAKGPSPEGIREAPGKCPKPEAGDSAITSRPTGKPFQAKTRHSTGFEMLSAITPHISKDVQVAEDGTIVGFIDILAVEYRDHSICRARHARGHRVSETAAP